MRRRAIQMFAPVWVYISTGGKDNSKSIRLEKRSAFVYQWNKTINVRFLSHFQISFQAVAQTDVQAGLVQL